jgi:hypothetical protein
MIFAWQGWQLEMPDDWSPVKLEGSFEQGYALLADIHRPRAGLRWSTPGRRFDSKRWAREALVAEVGQLAADEARYCELECYHNGLLYSEPDPPGRDVWVAISRVSGRTIELAHHVYKDEKSQMDRLQQGLLDSGTDDELNWSAFDLSCRTTGGCRLETHRLNAGDLSLEFARGSERLKLRQIAVAHLALKRMTIDRWLEQQIRPRLKSFAKAESNSALTVETADGRELHGVSCRLDRRKLAIWNVGLPVSVTQIALHDAKRDRLVLIEAKDLAAAEEFARSVGWAHQEVMC